MGGWPLTIIMDADKKPFTAGTYFPKKVVLVELACWSLFHVLRDIGIIIEMN